MNNSKLKESVISQGCSIFSSRQTGALIRGVQKVSQSSDDGYLTFVLCCVYLLLPHPSTLEGWTVLRLGQSQSACFSFTWVKSPVLAVLT